MKNYQITEWCHHFIREQVSAGDLCIDATMGNGKDTLLLSELAGKDGQVLAFDIQPAALVHTRELLDSRGHYANYRLILDSHENLPQYARPETVSCIVFNFGYLPGGDHTKATKASTSIPAIAASLSLLKKGGLLSLCIYHGKDSGTEERDAIFRYIRTLDPRRFLVIASSYLNRPNHPPIPVLIIRL